MSYYPEVLFGKFISPGTQTGHGKRFLLSANIMKKHATILPIALLCTIALTAQVKKSNLYVDLALNGNLISEKETLDLRVALQTQLEAGRRISKRFILGIGGGYGHFTDNTFVPYGNFSNYASNAFLSENIFLRWTFGSKKLSGHYEISLTQTSGKYRASAVNRSGYSFDANIRSTNFVLGCSVDASYHILKRLSINIVGSNPLSLRYSHAKGTYKYHFTGQVERVNESNWITSPYNEVGMCVSLGIKYRLMDK